MKALFKSIVLCVLFASCAILAKPPLPLNAIKVSKAPIIDGQSIDPIWQKATAVTIQDVVAKIPLTLKAVYTSDRIFFLVSYPDKTENRQHKAQVWNENQQLYVTGPKREDTFVFKWNMENHPNDLTLSSNASYRADVWFWKANRTDHATRADDKIQIYTVEALSNARPMMSKDGNIFYLVRKGDQGKSAYKTKIQANKTDAEIPGFNYQQPTGSRSDIQAKGIWKNGRWTIEFSRKLKTNYLDDIQFDTSKTYLFGVSRYEIAGRKTDAKLEQPKYGSGEVGQLLLLTFVK